VDDTAPELTIVIPVWDDHTRLLPRCLSAIDHQLVRTHIIIVDNASRLPVDSPTTAHLVALRTRHSIGAARNAGLADVTTPYVVFADADDEITPGSLVRSLDILHSRPTAAGVIGRSIVDEDGRYRRRGRTPRATFRLASRYAPGLASLFWLTAFQCSITSTVLRTATVRDAGGFPDTDIAEDWQLAARLARRGPLICLDDAVRIYHRHPQAARNTTPRHDVQALRSAICSDCITDPQASAVDRLFAHAVRSYSSAPRTR
jgi:cellulose synthase/poly-beta-1,6-N-acetylglucosamine synthase-like glycosyltransferase